MLDVGLSLSCVGNPLEFATTLMPPPPVDKSASKSNGEFVEEAAETAAEAEISTGSVGQADEDCLGAGTTFCAGGKSVNPNKGCQRKMTGGR